MVGGGGAEQVRDLIEARGGVLVPYDRLKLKQLVDRLTTVPG